MLRSMSPAPLIPLCLKNEAGEHGLKGRLVQGNSGLSGTGLMVSTLPVCSVSPRGGPSTGAGVESMGAMENSGVGESPGFFGRYPRRAMWRNGGDFPVTLPSPPVHTCMDTHKHICTPLMSGNRLLDPATRTCSASQTHSVY